MKPLEILHKKITIQSNLSITAVIDRLVAVTATNSRRYSSKTRYEGVINPKSFRIKKQNTLLLSNDNIPSPTIEGNIYTNNEAITTIELNISINFLNILLLISVLLGIFVGYLCLVSQFFTQSTLPFFAAVVLSFMLFIFFMTIPIMLWIRIDYEAEDFTKGIVHFLDAKIIA